MDIDCSQIIQNYLLNQNPLYAFSFPLSILIAIIVFGISKTYKWSDNSYINQILIPIVTFLLVMVLIDLISRAMLSKEKVDMLVNKCKYIAFKQNLPTHEEGFTSNEGDFNLSQEGDFNLSQEGFTSNKELESTDNPYMPDHSNPVPINLDDMNLNESKEKISDSLDIIPNIEPSPLEFNSFKDAMCVQPSNCCSLCSDSPNSNPCNLIAPIPGPQWIPQSAESVQNRLKNNDYTKAICPIQG